MYQKPLTEIQKHSYKNIENLVSKSVLLRACLNVITDENGNMIDDTRYQSALPFIKELSQSCKQLIIMGHLGRPEKVEERFSYKNNVYKLLTEDLFVGTNNHWSCRLVSNLDEISLESKNIIYLLDNIRFFPGEESDNPQERDDFASALASLADVFINDAFADYRKSVSTYYIAQKLPSYLGPTFMQEVEALMQLKNPKRPYIAVLGGAKLSEKLNVLDELLHIADKVLVGGAMAYTLLKAQGHTVGTSLVEEDKLSDAQQILEQFSDKLVLPVDHMIAEEFKEDAPYEYIDTVDIPDNKIAIDIGKRTIEIFKEAMDNAGTIFWNGPLGVFEFDHAAYGTKMVGKMIADHPEAYTVIGGGDSIAAIHQLGLTGFNHISLGGGAMLAFVGYDEFDTLSICM